MSSESFTSEQRSDSVRKALRYVGLAAFLFALMPTVIDFAGSADKPLTVGAGILAGFWVFTTAMYRLSYGRHRARHYSFRDVIARAASKDILLSSVVAVLATCVAGFATVMFALSTKYVDTAVTAALFETWPIIWFILVKFLDHYKYGPIDVQRHSKVTYIMMALALPAISLIVFSTHEGDHTTLGLEFGFGDLPWLGIVVAILGATIGALATFPYLFTDRVLYGGSSKQTDNWSRLPSDKRGVQIAEDAVSMVCVIIARSIASPIMLLFAFQESGFYGALTSRHFLFGFISGLCLNGPAMLALRRAHFATERREVIALQYFTPIGGLFFLWIFRGIDIARIDFLLLGTGAIIALNMLINVDPENPDQRIPKREDEDSESTSDERSSVDAGIRIEPEDDDRLPIKERHSLKALVVSLLTFGIFVYFRSNLIDSDKLAWEPGDYWGILALASTVFALLLAFRLTRVESLLTTEDQRTLSVVRRVELLPERFFSPKDGKSNRDTLLTSIRRLNRAELLETYRQAYNTAQIEISRIVDHWGDDGLTAEERRDLADIRSDLDALGHGRQSGREFAERIALWLMGGLIVIMSLAVPRQPEVWAQLLAEIFAIILSSVVLFLLFHLADVRRSRGDELLRRESEDSSESLPAGLYVRFRLDSEVRWQRILSGGIIIGLVVLIFGLLAWDRLGI